MTNETIYYRVTYSVGTSAYDERRYFVKVAERDLARRITSLQSKGKRVYSVERAY